VDMLLSLSQAYLGRWQLKHQRTDEDQIRLRVRQSLMVQPDSEEALKVLMALTKSINHRRNWLIGLGLFTGAAIAGVVGVLFWQGELPYVIQKRDKVEMMEKKLNEEITILRQNQEDLKKEISLLESRLNQEDQARFNQLQSKIYQLEKSIRELQQKNLIFPMPTP